MSGTVAPPGASGVRNLLLAGGVHHPVEASAPSLVDALARQGIATDVEEDIEAGLRRLAGGGYRLLTVSALRWRMQDPKYDAHRARWGLALSEEARAAIRAHLRGGGALLALHTAAICFDDWLQWGEILGARWVWGQSGHAPFGEVEVQFDAAPPGSIAAGLSAFACEDEVYERMWLAPDVQPLAHARNRSTPEGGPGPWTPVLWTREWEGARVVFDALGHNARSLDHPVHRALLERAVTWVLGRENPASATANKA
ncbi:MAG: ThuA domain-containing protein [Rhodoferax sp.]|nr:ThuA domain-containing protein [Rhodoferax sp.]